MKIHLGIILVIKQQEQQEMLEDEKEIRLFKNTPLKINKLWINDEEVDITFIKNKIFKA